jgi:glycosyltransferase involved in cell wall biosynthesis
MSIPHSSPRRVVFLGTYTLHPRQRLLLEALSTHPDWEVTECHRNPWGSAKDKTLIKGGSARLRIILRFFFAYPLLALQYLRQPAHDLVVMMHPGLMDVLLLGWLVKCRKTPLAWDIYISMFDTLVNDRGLLRPNRTPARFLRWLERTAMRNVDVPFIDTRAHADYLEKLYEYPKGGIGVVHVGVDSEFLQCLRQQGNPRGKDTRTGLKALFYGQFIPLHGVDTLVHAVSYLKSSEINLELTLVGEGQTSVQVDRLIAELSLTNIRRISWLNYPELTAEIMDSDFCLGIFGSTGKAGRVIPNKLYQIAAAGVPFVTGDTPGLREFRKLADKPLPCLAVPPGDPKALKDALWEIAGQPPLSASQGFVFGVPCVRREFIALLESTVFRKDTRS